MGPTSPPRIRLMRDRSRHPPPRLLPTSTTQPACTRQPLIPPTTALDNRLTHLRPMTLEHVPPSCYPAPSPSPWLSPRSISFRFLLLPSFVPSWPASCTCEPPTHSYCCVRVVRKQRQLRRQARTGQNEA